MSYLCGPSSPGRPRTRFPVGCPWVLSVTAPQLVLPRLGVKLCAGRSRSSPTDERTRETGGRPAALEERYRRLADTRKKRPAAAVAARFTEIDGATLSALVSIQLFTTVIPLIVIGFDYFSGFGWRTPVREHFSSGRSASYTR